MQPVERWMMGVEPNGRRARRGDWPRTETIRPRPGFAAVQQSHGLGTSLCLTINCFVVQAYLRIATSTPSLTRRIFRRLFLKIISGSRLTRKLLQDFPFMRWASVCYKSYNGPIDLRVKQRESAVRPSIGRLRRNAGSRSDATGFA